MGVFGKGRRESDHVEDDRSCVTAEVPIVRPWCNLLRKSSIPQKSWACQTGDGHRSVAEIELVALRNEMALVKRRDAMFYSPFHLTGLCYIPPEMRIPCLILSYSCRCGNFSGYFVARLHRGRRSISERAAYNSLTVAHHSSTSTLPPLHSHILRHILLVLPIHTRLRTTCCQLSAASRARSITQACRSVTKEMPRRSIW